MKVAVNNKWCSRSSFFVCGCGCSPCVTRDSVVRPLLSSTPPPPYPTQQPTHTCRQSSFHQINYSPKGLFEELDEQWFYDLPSAGFMKVCRGCGGVSSFLLPRLLVQFSRKMIKFDIQDVRSWLIWPFAPSHLIKIDLWKKKDIYL